MPPSPRVALALVAALVLVGLGCRGAKKRLVAAASAGGGAWEVPVVPAPSVTGIAGCPAVDVAKIAPYEVDRSLVDAPVPGIVDAKGALAPFYDRVLALARGIGKEHVRVGVYGDSNLTSDHLTGHIRRELQARFGDAGHGFVGLAMPWGWYTHEDVHHHGTWSAFKQVDCTTDPVPGHRYGFANLGAESGKNGAAAWVGTADGGAAIGVTASRFEVYFLKQPGGGSFDVELDGEVIRTVTTKAVGFEAGFERVETTDAPHELRCIVKGDGMVRFYGTTLERGSPGLVIDSLGTGGMNFQRFMLTEPLIRRTQLEHRKYDLVVVWLGMNSTVLGPNRGWVRDTITTLRTALPGVPVLMMTPPDTVRAGDMRSDPRILEVVTQLREVSEESGAALWDLHAAMGGDASFLHFMRHRLASPDRAHLLREGSQILGQRFLAALFAGVAARAEAMPRAGCDHSM